MRAELKNSLQHLRNMFGRCCKAKRVVLMLEELKNTVSYEDFGAVGDGVTNDFFAIKATHEYANEKGVAVRACRGKTYLISDTRNGSGEVELDEGSLKL